MEGKVSFIAGGLFGLLIALAMFEEGENMALAGMLLFPVCGILGMLINKDIKF